MAERYDMPILYSCHPRSRKRLEAAASCPEPSRRIQLDAKVIQHEPLGLTYGFPQSRLGNAQASLAFHSLLLRFHDYNCLQMRMAA